ncbi:MAG: hypothetical protein CM1200mP15_15400 [Dehalococcoidia bacterium]|nr:MAG: hypothetical protein CM1200mP15_15400 [Dehalococcoidia bacterium]
MTPEFFIAPFQYAFMIRALIVCILVGIMCPLLGAFVINREMSFMGDALGHPYFTRVSCIVCIWIKSIHRCTADGDNYRTSHWVYCEKDKNIH